MSKYAELVPRAEQSRVYREEDEAIPCSFVGMSLRGVVLRNACMLRDAA